MTYLEEFTFSFYLHSSECSFVSKAIKAEQAGAIAIIVTETQNEEEQGYIEMIADETGRKPSIPAYFLLGSNGDFIRNTLYKEGLPDAIINIPLNMSNVQIRDMNQPPWILW